MKFAVSMNMTNPQNQIDDAGEHGGFRANGGRPRLKLDYKAITADVKEVLDGSEETITSIALKHQVSRAWIHRNIYPSLEYVPDRRPSYNFSSA